VAEPLKPKPPAAPAAGARSHLTVNLMGKRYRLNIAVTAEELKNKPAEVIEIPKPSKFKPARSRRLRRKDPKLSPLDFDDQ
jgi:hypothetical protein